MALSARELVFYIRAENQASRVFRRVASDIKALPSKKELQVRAQAAQATSAATGGAYRIQAQQVKLTEGIENARLSTQREMLNNQLKSNSLVREYNRAQQAIRVNDAAIAKARMAANDAQVVASRARATGGPVYADLAAQAQLAEQKVSMLSRQEQILNDDLETSRIRTRLWGVETQEALQAAKAAKFDAIANSVGHIGKAFTLAGAVGLATMTFLGHKAAQFQSQVTLAATQARPNNAPVSRTLEISARLQQTILRQMQQFPATSKEMADSLYQIFSSTNATIPQAVGLLRTFNKAAVAGGASLHDMTEAGISIRNNFPHEFKNMTDAMQTFFAAVRYGRMNATQFANSLAYILPIAKEVHSNFKNVAQDMAFFTRQTGGRLTRQDAQGYARLIQLLGRTDVAKGLADKGVAVFDKQTGAMRPLIKIMADVNKQFKGQGPQAILNFFKNISAAGSGKSGTQGTIQAIRIFAQARENLHAYDVVVKLVKDDTDEFSKSYRAMARTPGVRWAVLVNQFRAFALTLGNAALPALMELGKILFPIFQKFNKMSDSTKKLVAEIVVFGSAGSILGGVLLMLGSPIIRLIGWLVKLRGSKVAGLLGAEDGFLSAGAALRTGLIGALLAAVFVMIKYHTQTVHVVNAMGGFKKVLGALTAILIGLKLTKLVGGMIAARGAAAAATTEVEALGLSLQTLVATPFIVAIVLDITYRKQISNAISAAANAVLHAVGINTSPGAKFSYKDYQKLVKTNPVLAKQLMQNEGIKFPRQLPGGPDVLTPAQRKVANEPPIPGRGAMRTGRGDAGTPNDKYPQAAAAIANAIADAKAKLAQIAALKAKTVRAANLNSWVQAQIKNIVKLDAYALKHNNVQAHLAAEQAHTLLNTKLKNNADLLAAANDVISAEESADKKHTKKVVSEAKKRAAAQKKAAEQAQAAVTQAAQSQQQAYDTMYQANQGSFGQLFNGPYINSPRVQNRLQWGGKLRGKDYLADLKSQIKAFKNWRGIRARLVKAGIPWALLQEIDSAMGSDPMNTIGEAKALLQLSSKDLHSYFKMFGKGQSMIQTATQQDFNQSLKHYRQFGRNIALQIMQGLRDEHTPILSYFEKMILKMFPGLAKDAKGKAKPITKGTLHDHHPTAASPSPKKPPRPRKPVVGRSLQSATTTHNENTTYIVTAPDASVKTQVKHAHFVHRARYRGI